MATTQSDIRPLRIAALVKQVPRFDELAYGADGRLLRDHVELEMNPYCRRAVAQAIELAQEVGGESCVITMGPPSAEDCLREAIVCGVDRGVLLTDPRCAGSDTLATAHALKAVIDVEGPFDLVFVGQNSVDADTGQVGPELAQLLDHSFAGPVREFEIDADRMTFAVNCETDDGFRRLTGPLPAVISCAERLIAPAKASPDLRAGVPASQIEVIDTGSLSGDVWGLAASPTRVGESRIIAQAHNPLMMVGDLSTQVADVVKALAERGAFSQDHFLSPFSDEGTIAELAEGPGQEKPNRAESPAANRDLSVWAVVEPDNLAAVRELACEAVRLATEVGGQSELIVMGELDPVVLGEGVSPDSITELVATDLTGGETSIIEEDYARVLSELVSEETPWLVIVSATAAGREVASRVAASQGLGLTGDAVGFDISDETIPGQGRPQAVAWKPAFGGRMVTAITSNSPVQMATVRPGILGHRLDGAHPTSGSTPPPNRRRIQVDPKTQMQVLGRTVNDDFMALGSASVVLGVGMGVQPDEYKSLESLRELLQAELGATRKVTDQGWLPRGRQIGITGRSVAPNLFISIAAEGKFNHTVGFRAAKNVLAINANPEAEIFKTCDFGIIADWHDVIPLLEAELRQLGLG